MVDFVKGWSRRCKRRLVVGIIGNGVLFLVEILEMVLVVYGEEV